MRDDGSEVQGRGYWHWQPQERSPASRASAAGNAVIVQMQPGKKQYLQRAWGVLDAGEGVSRAACTAPGFGSVDGRRVLLLHMCAHGKGFCVPAPKALRNSVPWCTKMETNLSEK